MKKMVCVLLALVCLVGGCAKMESSDNEQPCLTCTYVPNDYLHSALPNTSDRGAITPTPTLPGYLLKNPLFVIEGEQISGETISMVRYYNVNSVILPFTVVCKGLGYDVQWENKSEAIIRIHGEQKINANFYILSLADKTLCRKGNDWNILIPPPGNTFFYCEVINQELYLDWETLSSAFYWAGVRIVLKENDLDKEYIEIKKLN